MAKDIAPETDVEGREHPLLPIQLRFFGEDAGDRHHWNQAVLLMPKSPLDWKLVERSIAALVAHHAALRLRFEEVDGDWRATYGSSPACYRAQFRSNGVSNGDSHNGDSHEISQNGHPANGDSHNGNGDSLHGQQPGRLGQQLVRVAGGTHNGDFGTGGRRTDNPRGRAR